MGAKQDINNVRLSEAKLFVQPEKPCSGYSCKSAAHHHHFDFTYTLSSPSCTVNLCRSPRVPRDFIVAPERSSRSSAGHVSLVSRIMDSVYAIGLGLGLRLLLDSFSDLDVRVGGTLVGLWEGVVLYHFMNRWPSSPDPFIGLMTRLSIDYLITESFERFTVVLLWTGIGAVISDIAPTVWRNSGLERQFRYVRRDLRRIGFDLPSFPVASAGSSRTRVHERTLSTTSSTVTDSRVAATAEEETVVVPHSFRPPRPRPPGAFPGTWSDDGSTILPIPPPNILRTPPRPFSTIDQESMYEDEPLGPVVPDYPNGKSPPYVAQAAVHNSLPSSALRSPTSLTPRAMESRPPLSQMPSIPGESTVNLTMMNRELSMEQLARTSFRNSDPPPPFPEAESRPYGSILKQGRAESLISDLSENTLLNHALIYRHEADEEETEKKQLAQRMKEALDAGRSRDAFLLKLEVEEANERGRKLREKANEHAYRGAFELCLMNCYVQVLIQSSPE
jgi:hypothetical protein